VIVGDLHGVRTSYSAPPDDVPDNTADQQARAHYYCGPKKAQSKSLTGDKGGDGGT
jgi:hypothetical protein